MTIVVDASGPVAMRNEILEVVREIQDDALADRTPVASPAAVTRSGAVVRQVPLEYPVCKIGRLAPGETCFCDECVAEANNGGRRKR